MKFKDLTGKVFNKLTVIDIYGQDSHLRYIWNCKCECGVLKSIPSAYLISGKTKSCGCLLKQVVSKLHKKHGDTCSGKTAEYRVWRALKSRCLNKNLYRYKDYGGRGIKVCDRWLNSFENFLNDMGRKPTPKHSLDRYPDINGNYEPNNCRWATDTEQAKGQRSNRWIVYGDKELILQDWAIFLEVSPDILSYHLKTKTMADVILYFKNKNKKYLSRTRNK
jgi:hypothetical protein